MRRLLFVLLALASWRALGADATWILTSMSGQARAGARFEVTAFAAADEALPDAIDARIRARGETYVVPLEAVGPQNGPRRTYAGIMPSSATGVVTLEAAEQPSNKLLLSVAAHPDAVHALTHGVTPQGESAESEPPLSEYEPMYFVVGIRGGDTARFQLSFKYRLFDFGSGFGREEPWLTGLYFGYTQTSLWDLSAQSRPFRDTSYRPALFWRWRRTDEKTWVDEARLGLEHESNGRGGAESRSINIAFVQPQWNWRVGAGRVEFAPKLYRYLEKSDNPDIARYRGYADWHLRYDSGANWIAEVLARRGTSGKGSVLLDLSRRVRDFRVGPVSGYFHVQFFTGYGETLLDYNVRRESQLRLGFAIVP